mmetsp:Transcript_32245/g.104163  ORF Transcript_32245/g.104163 Transcript_32245/m.104163 type:complete len:237 (+) Transcript_32245:490-1200(+)
MEVQAPSVPEARAFMCATIASAAASGEAGVVGGRAVPARGSAHLPSTVACETSTTPWPHAITLDTDEPCEARTASPSACATLVIPVTTLSSPAAVATINAFVLPITPATAPGASALPAAWNCAGSPESRIAYLASPSSPDTLVAPLMDLTSPEAAGSLSAPITLSSMSPRPRPPPAILASTAEPSAPPAPPTATLVARPRTDAATGRKIAREASISAQVRSGLRLAFARPNAVFSF